MLFNSSGMCSSNGIHQKCAIVPQTQKNLKIQKLNGGQFDDQAGCSQITQITSQSQPQCSQLTDQGAIGGMT